MNKPEFITFTGADDKTSVHAMMEISKSYPVEWGILFSTQRQGSGRYPSLTAIRTFSKALGQNGVRLAAHICGSVARSIEAGSSVDMREFIVGFKRAQINIATKNPNLRNIREWADAHGVEPILQCRGPFPSSTEVSWLYDCSGGRGESPEIWPAQPPGMTVGYAGGIGPDNVRDVLTLLPTNGPFWIDMENRVRTDDVFDLNKVLEVCKKAYEE